MLQEQTPATAFLAMVGVCSNHQSKLEFDTRFQGESAQFGIRSLFNNLYQ